jgi:hypothetical protein
MNLRPKTLLVIAFTFADGRSKKLNGLSSRSPARSSIMVN